jgi:aminomuconate-semialdehyde/2-hydroxymuconate-6-semialdehyde dehydrogenase
VAEKIYDKFMNLFLAAIDEWTVGDPTELHTKMGPLVSRAHLDKVLSYINLARQEGGNIVRGGNRPAHVSPQGFFLEPTVITGISLKSPVMQHEIFGPVVTVTIFDGSEAEAVAFANDVHYGLCASIWTQDITKANRVARMLDVGTVWINCWMIRDVQVPFGGMKASGLGREGGWFSFDFFTEKKTISTALN